MPSGYFIAADLVSRACLRERISTVNNRPDDPRRPFRSVEEAYTWVVGFVAWYNEHRRHPDHVYEQTRQRHPRRWSRTIHRWHEPQVVWINQPHPDNGIIPATSVMPA